MRVFGVLLVLWLYAAAAALSAAPARTRSPYKGTVQELRLLLRGKTAPPDAHLARWLLAYHTRLDIPIGRTFERRQGQGFEGAIVEWIREDRSYSRKFFNDLAGVVGFRVSGDPPLQTRQKAVPRGTRKGGTLGKKIPLASMPEFDDLKRKIIGTLMEANYEGKLEVFLDRLEEISRGEEIGQMEETWRHELILDPKTEPFDAERDGASRWRYIKDGELLHAGAGAEDLLFDESLDELWRKGRFDPPPRAVKYGNSFLVENIPAEDRWFKLFWNPDRVRWTLHPEHVLQTKAAKHEEMVRKRIAVFRRKADLEPSDQSIEAARIAFKKGSKTQVSDGLLALVDGFRHDLKWREAEMHLARFRPLILDFSR